MLTYNHEEFWTCHVRCHRERLEREGVAGRLWLAQVVSFWAARLEPDFYERPASASPAYLERSI